MNKTQGDGNSLREATYQERDGCWNCAHVFHRWEYEEEGDFFCAHNAGKKPMSGGANDRFYTLSEPARSRAIKVWEAWSSGRGVSQHGWCEEHAN